MLDPKDYPPLRVLLVEDSMLTVEHIGEAFAELPLRMQVKVAQSQNEALAIVEDFNPEIVVLDLKLKGGNGFRVLKELRTSEVKTLVVVMTNYALPNYKKYAMLLGADHFLDKSFDLPKLKSIVADFGSSQGSGTQQRVTT